MIAAIKDFFPFVVILVIFALCLLILIWAFHDAESRGKSGLLVVIMVVLLGLVPGLLIWYILRPQTLSRESQ